MPSALAEKQNPVTLLLTALSKGRQVPNMTQKLVASVRFRDEPGAMRNVNAI
jgi:hypothetical protein